MASTSGKKTSSSKKSSRGAASKSSTRKKTNTYQREQDSELFHEIGLIVLFAAMVILFLCNFGIIGPVGDAVSGVLFGVFGFTAYIAPIMLFLAVAFGFANEGNPNAARKIAAGAVLFLMAGVVCDLLAQNASSLALYDVKILYENCKTGKNGGGILAGSLAYFLHHYLETIGTVLVVLLCSAISFILLTERSLISGVKEGSSRIRELSREESERRREQNQLRRLEQEEVRSQRRLEQDETRAQRRQEQEEARAQRRAEQEEARAQRRLEQEEARARREEEKRLRAEEKENEKILRMDRKVTGVMADTSLPRNTEERCRDDIHEIIYCEKENNEETENKEGFKEYSSGEAEAAAANEPQADGAQNPAFDFERIRIRSAHQVTLREAEEAQENGYIEEQEDGYPAAGQDNGYPDEARQSGYPDEAQQSGYPNETQQRGYLDEMQEIGYSEEAADNIQCHAPAGTTAGDRAASGFGQDSIRVHTEGRIDGPQETEFRQRPVAKLPEQPDGERSASDLAVQKEMQNQEKRIPKKYIFPPLSRLAKGAAKTVDSTRELKETAMRLQQTLATFGVRVTITDISQGPSVTRYEMQPEQGVKVSKIVNLADDIKLNLAATDIRIEAPIPGKAAVGIEVPNKENMMVALRDLLESKEFREFPSNLAFAVGKDIAGQVVVADIAKMPHMLIAGSTGSGKSVCINTLIMSILYKAHPDDVKLIMVDPKVVELSVYNGIPHLLIPVVTDPKKAAAALHWGVSEMTDRYKKFADFNVRDLKGYNKKVEAMREAGDESAPSKLPQIVIIVDELADLMMVAPGEVEESICRLAQLARAAGIHLIIATQRPSVDVITGLIKANMPSRVAFAVSSGVDSRTILDMNGAEKLLGKGDMLFYPQGYSKPARIQGAFVSDKEVGDVVDFLKNQAIGNVYAEEVEAQIRNMGSGGGAGSSGADERDEYFEEAGRFIIDKDKASIGMLQRVLKIGFNRAARIMDQLCEYGVVGEEEGTKPRKVLMSMEQFEQLLEEI